MKKEKIINSILIVILMIVLCCGGLLFGNDYASILRFWFTLLIMGIIFLPITALIFKNSKSSGWIFSKAICLGISGVLMWLISYTKVIQYSQRNSYLILFLLSIVNVIIGLKNKEELKKKSNQIQGILITEIFFLIVLFCWIYIKGLNPTIDFNTEKYMDYGFMNSIMNTKYMPPEDIWLSGNSINYYYFGQYISGFLCKISGIQVIEGYNLVLALISSFVFAMPFSIGYDLAITLIEKKRKILKKIIPITLALFMGISMSLSGTLHFPIYKFFAENKENYYFADGTRYIGFNPETNDKVNTENPAYASIVGDLHAHFIDLIFSFTIIAIMFHYLFSKNDSNWKTNVFSLHIIISALLLGIQKMTNYWDFVIYFVIIGIIVAIKQVIDNGFNIKAFKNILIILLEIIIIQELITFPFSRDFKMISSRIMFTQKHTAFYQLLVLWGLPMVSFISLAIPFFIKFVREKKNVLDFCNLNLCDTFIIILGLCGLGLIAISEIVYVKDIYGEEYARFNTVFKLTYQSFILLNICTNYIIAKLLLNSKKILVFFGIILAILNISTIGYGIDALNVMYKDTTYQGIGNIYNDIKNSYYNDYEAIEWINSNIEKDKVILEASSYDSSYTISSRVSVFTGNPTIIGWYVHEWLWRNENYQMPQNISKIVEDAREIYTNEKGTREKLIELYNISYIFIGKYELETYDNIDMEGLLQIGDVVFSTENNDDETNTIIIKVK